MQSRLILARHGETFFNLEDRLGGDSELTEKGKEIAEGVARLVSGFKIDTIYCSTLKRSIQSAEIIKKHMPRTGLVEVGALVEINAGDLDSKSYAEFERDFPELFRQRKNDRYNWRFPNGESYADALGRIKGFFDELKEKDGTFLVVGHRGINRLVLEYTLGLAKPQIPKLVIPNKVVFCINLTSKEVYHITPEGKIVSGYVVQGKEYA